MAHSNDRTTNVSGNQLGQITMIKCLWLCNFYIHINTK